MGKLGHRRSTTSRGRPIGSISATTELWSTGQMRLLMRPFCASQRFGSRRAAKRVRFGCASIGKRVGSKRWIEWTRSHDSQTRTACGRSAAPSLERVDWQPQPPGGRNAARRFRPHPHAWFAGVDCLAHAERRQALPHRSRKSPRAHSMKQIKLGGLHVMAHAPSPFRQKDGSRLGSDCLSVRGSM